MIFPMPLRSGWARYGFATAITAAGLGARLLLAPWLGGGLPFVTVFPAVAVSVWYGGYQGGILAALAGYAGAALLFIEPAGSLLPPGPAELAGLAGYLVSCAIIILFGEAMHRARFRAEARTREVRDQREWFHATLASIGDAVITTDTAGLITFINPVAESLTGWSRSEALGQPIDRVIRMTRSQTGEPVDNPVHQVLRDGRAGGLSSRTELVALDGSRNPIEDSAAPIRDAAGEVTGVVMVFRDSGERQARESEVRESEARLRAFLETSIDGIVTMDFEGRILEFNPAAERLFGYARSEAIGRLVADLLIPDRLREAHHQGLARYLATGAGPILDRRVEMPALRSDGSEFPVELSVTRIMTPGLPVFMAHVRDISDRIRAERRRTARLAVTQLLAESGSLHDAGILILEAMANALDWDVGALWVVDPEAEVLRCESFWSRRSASVANFARITRERTFTRGVGLPGRIWQTGRAAWIPDVTGDSNFPRAPFAAADGLRGAFGFPIRFGSRFFGIVEFFSAQVREPDEDLMEMVTTMGGMLGQVMERRRVEQKTAAELREADRKKDEFLATLSHELRNPLAPLRNALELLRRDRDRAGVDRALPVMERQLSQLVRLVDDLLDLSRITRRAPELRKERITLAAAIRNAIETSRPLIEERGHSLVVSLPPDPVWLEADLTRMAQVFSNLLNNAARYTEPEGRISITAERQDQAAVIRIRDTGMGIPADHLPRIFDMFAQVDQSLHRSGGLGIGLTLVKRLVELHGGTVAAASEGPGKGSEFTVRIPVAPGPPEPAPARRPERSGGRRRRVLVVDDNHDSTATLAMVLQLMGHEIRTAADGIAAIEAAESFRPEVILLDIGLPRLSGYEACRRIRAQPWGRDMAVIALTGWGQEADKARALEAGFTLHLVKPVDPQELEQLLQSV